jgi:hypothetical protein
LACDMNSTCLPMILGGFDPELYRPNLQVDGDGSTVNLQLFRDSEADPKHQVCRWMAFRDSVTWVKTHRR